MRKDTPPPSPGASVGEEEAFDIGEIEEVIEIDDDTNLEDIELGGASEHMEEEEGDVEVVDMAATVFSAHKDSVFSCEISPSGLIAATGGEDDVAHIWDLTSGKVLFSCSGHKDSVTCVGFNHDGSLLATGDMSGYIQVWKIATSTKIWEFETSDLNWLLWHSGSNVLFAGTNDGDMWMWLVPQGHTRTFPSYGVATQCGCLTHDGKRAVLGYEDGSVRVFDLKSGQLLHQFTDAYAHEQAVTSIACHQDNTIAITGSMDGTAKLLNSQSGKTVGAFDCQTEGNVSSGTDEEMAQDAQVDHTVEVVSFCPTLPNIAVTSTLAGLITIWDISSRVSRHILVQGCGSSQLAWHPKEPIVYSAGLDGRVRSYDVRSGQPVTQYTGHKKSILSIAISKDGKSLLTSSDDGTARVFKLG